MPASPTCYCGDRAIRQLAVRHRAKERNREAKQCGPERDLRSARAEKLKTNNRKVSTAKPRRRTTSNDHQQTACMDANVKEFRIPARTSLNPKASVQSLSATGSHLEDGSGGEVEGGRNRLAAHVCICLVKTSSSVLIVCPRGKKQLSVWRMYAAKMEKPKRARHRKRKSRMRRWAEDWQKSDRLDWQQ